MQPATCGADPPPTTGDISETRLRKKRMTCQCKPSAKQRAHDNITQEVHAEQNS